MLKEDSEHHGICVGKSVESCGARDVLPIRRSAVIAMGDVDPWDFDIKLFYLVDYLSRRPNVLEGPQKYRQIFLLYPSCFGSGV